MQRKTIFVSPTQHAWDHVAKALSRQYPAGLGSVRIVVPTVAHAALLRASLLALPEGAMRASNVSTMSVWIASQEPDKNIGVPESEKRRLLSLYEELRKHDWLKDLFSARTNSDMFPLAETLLDLCNELTEALLPAMEKAPADAESRWDAALAQLPPNVRDMLADESKLVWEIWKGQLDNKDATSIRFAQMMRIAGQASEDLVWVSSAAPTPMEEAFLHAYGENRPVIQVCINWSRGSIDRLYAQAWPEILNDNKGEYFGELETPANVSIIRAKSLEDEAQQGAQTLIDWVATGKKSVAIIAQDRIVARRIRALLERAEIYVADETGWKLSTTRAASAVMSMLDVAIAVTKSRALLDFLKCPYMLTDMEDKLTHAMAVEAAIRQGNVRGGWAAIKRAIVDLEVGQKLVNTIESCTDPLSGQNTMLGWIERTLLAMSELGMVDSLANDPAGAQLLEVFEQLKETFSNGQERFTLKEWKKFFALQMEAASFIAPGTDTRVVMMPLNGARLRSYEAVLLAGADANHLPSQVGDTMFFANTVRRELGLATREVLQQQQMRDFAEVLQSGAEVVLSFQAMKQGQPVAITPWIERLQLVLECSGLAPIPVRSVPLKQLRLVSTDAARPMPRASELTPTMMSPSGYNSMMACPYQFFATRMLGLKSISDLTDEAEKRSYGNWVHEILNDFHVIVRDNDIQDRDALLRDISEKVFARELAKNPTALGYRSRWMKIIPVYLQWTAQLEAQGWHFFMGEQKLEKLVHFEGGSIMLEGRVDRLDKNEEDDLAVLDYKSSSFAVLKDKIDQKEDQQLPFYGLLPKKKAKEGSFVPLEMSDPAKACISASNYPEWMDALERRIIGNVISIKKNEPLPANGADVACKFCEVSGICRKSAWKNSELVA
jgi:ATP-dependent helicase/nuclease subunit B